MNKESFIEPSSDLKSDPGFAYHATNIDNLFDIINEGKLKVFGPSHGTDQEAWPDGSEEGRSYWSKDASIVHSFAPSEGTPVVIRTRLTNGFKIEKGTGDLYRTSPLDANKIEVLLDSGWVKITAALVQGELDGGLADGVPSTKFDRTELNKGIKVEKEHTNNPELAEEIAKDHLIEHKWYYTFLKLMEDYLTKIGGKTIKAGQTEKALDKLLESDKLDRRLVPGLIREGKVLDVALEICNISKVDAKWRLINAFTVALSKEYLKGKHQKQILEVFERYPDFRQRLGLFMSDLKPSQKSFVISQTYGPNKIVKALARIVRSYRKEILNMADEMILEGDNNFGEIEIIFPELEVDHLALNNAFNSLGFPKKYRNHVIEYVGVMPSNNQMVAKFVLSKEGMDEEDLFI